MIHHHKQNSGDRMQKRCQNIDSTKDWKPAAIDSIECRKPVAINIRNNQSQSSKKYQG